MTTKPAHSDAISRFRTTRVYEDETTARQVSQGVHELREEQRRSRASRSRLGWICVLCFAFGLVCLLAGTANEIDALQVVGGMALICGIPLTVMFARARPFDTSRIETLERLAGLLVADMAPDAALRLRLDLQPPDHQSKQTRTGAVGQWQVRYFSDPWLRLGGRLLDGTTFQLGLVTAHQARRKTRRSASGKYKTKHKTKQALRAKLRLQVKSARYPGLAALAQQSAGNGVARIAAQIRLPEQARIEGLDVSADGLELSAHLGLPDQKAAPAHHAAAMMFLGLYRVLNFVRANDKSQQPGGEP